MHYDARLILEEYVSVDRERVSLSNKAPEDDKSGDGPLIWRNLGFRFRLHRQVYHPCRTVLFCLFFSKIQVNFKGTLKNSHRRIPKNSYGRRSWWAIYRGRHSLELGSSKNQRHISIWGKRNSKRRSIEERLNALLGSAHCGRYRTVPDHATSRLSRCTCVNVCGAAAARLWSSFFLIDEQNLRNRDRIPKPNLIGILL